MTANATPLAQISAQSTEAEVLKRHEPLIRSMALPFVEGGANVDDLLQEGRLALLLAFRVWSRRPDAQFWSYARKAVFGSMCDFVTREIGEPSRAIADETDALHDIEDEAQSPEERLNSLQSLDVVLSKMVQLSQQQRQILRMRFCDDMKMESIAQELGIGVGGVHNAMKRALKILREHLESRDSVGPS